MLTLSKSPEKSLGERGSPPLGTAVLGNRIEEVIAIACTDETGAKIIKQSKL